MVAERPSSVATSRTMGPFSSRVVLLTFLYFIQGLPYGLQARFLPVYLRTKGHSLTSLGFFKMLLAPWLCKALWAPLVDRYSSKQTWLQGSIIGLIVVCALTSVMPPDNAVCLCVSIFLLNLFAATQDIVVDSVAVNILTSEELGQGNTAQVVGYKIGAIFGGGILVWFMDFLGWTGLFLALTLLYVEALMFVYLSPTMRTYNRVQMRIKASMANPQSNCENVKENDKETNARTSTIPSDSGSESTHSNNQSTGEVRDSCESIQVSTEKEELTNTNLQFPSQSIDPVSSGSNSDKSLVDQTDKAQVDGDNLVQEKTDDFDHKGISNIDTPEEDNDSNKELLLETENTKTVEPNVCTLEEQSDDSSRESPIERIYERVDKITAIKNSDVKENNSEEEDRNVINPAVKSSLETKVSAETPEKSVLEPPRSNNEESVSNIADVNQDECDLGLLRDEENEEESIDISSSVPDDNFATGLRKRKVIPETPSLEESEDNLREISETSTQDSLTSSPDKVSGHFDFLWELINVPDTRWVMVYVLIYKLGEQGALGMLPLFFVDSRVKATDVTFWTGVVGQGTSILGSCLGGWILSHPKYKLPSKLLIYQLSLFRLLPLGMLLWVVLLWTTPMLSPVILYRVAILALNMLLLVSGMVTTATFTLMMECTRQAPPHIQATHYTFLSSLEVFGKLMFMSVCGALVDLFGYTTMYLIFVVLAAALLPWLWRYPDILCRREDIY